MNKGINFKNPPTKRPNVRVSNLWPLRRVEQCIGWLTNTKTLAKAPLEKTRPGQCTISYGSVDRKMTFRRCRQNSLHRKIHLLKKRVGQDSTS